MAIIITSRSTRPALIVGKKEMKRLKIKKQIHRHIKRCLGYGRLDIL